MKHYRQILSASSFSLLVLATGTSFAQAVNAPNEAATAHRPDAGSMYNAAGGEDWSSMDFSSGAFLKNHPRLAKAFKFLNNESYRAGIEANMSAADKQTIESAVADAKSNLATLKELRPQYKTARAAHDSLALYQLEKSSRPNFDQLVTDRRTIIDIIAKYKFSASAATTGSLLDPVYPNPVHLGGSAANITYHTQDNGPIRIVVTDASGNTVKELANDTETAGDHTISLGADLPGAGTYYVTIESNGSRATQKVAVVQ